MKSRIRRASIFQLIRSQTTRCFTSNNLYSGYHPCKFGPCRQTADANLNLNINFAIVYYGPISSTIKKVKLLSLSTCCLSVSLGPVITFMTSQDMNVILKGAVASSVVFLSASTTALRWQPGSDTFDVEMLSWLASHIPETVITSE
ncbi:hypothetical protein POM88_006235 [Heracleum sosnowskyi]|uniref:Uncharacterized protein n=1 Tax=Heracleum sosnowskyi TaxID=360622 RepID=A0AAD8J5M3_9APIA|nr:hypothetical protein POM88_006235 [Heracleum sosnowskyi]